jgi:hypothetical protein
MSDLTDYDVIEAMVRYGGSFVRSLGQLYRQADADNQRRLREAFQEYFTEYRDIALRQKVAPAGGAQE